MRTILSILIAVSVLSLLSGCTALNNMSESVKDKNIAAGSETWGGNIELSLISPECPLPTITLWFGRRRVWYISLKDDAKDTLPETVKASNTNLSVGAHATGITIDNKGN